MEDIFHKYVESQGWETDVQVDLLLRFIEETSLPSEFDEFLRDVANDEHLGLVGDDDECDED
jgi:hypothetical protein